MGPETRSGKVVSKSKFVKSNNKFILFSCCKEDWIGKERDGDSNFFSSISSSIDGISGISFKYWGNIGDCNSNCQKRTLGGIADWIPIWYGWFYSIII